MSSSSGTTTGAEVFYHLTLDDIGPVAAGSSWSESFASTTWSSLLPSVMTLDPSLSFQGSTLAPFAYSLAGASFAYCEFSLFGTA